MAEDREQKALIKWSQQPEIRGKFPCLKFLYHIPNGGKRDPIEGKHLKQMGVKSGVPDLHFPVPNVKYHGFYIEMKYGNNKPSENQKWWIKRLRKLGHRVEVCYTWQEAAAALVEYISEGVILEDFEDDGQGID